MWTVRLGPLARDAMVLEQQPAALLVRSESETGDEEGYCSRRRGRRLVLLLARSRSAATIRGVPACRGARSPVWGLRADGRRATVPRLDPSRRSGLHGRGCECA